MGAIESFQVVEHGTIYRSATGLQGYYPRVVRLGAQELLASFVGSVGLETPDCRPLLSRSLDGGATWTLQGPVEAHRPAEYPPTETGFISRDADGSLLCLGAQWPVDPQAPETPLIHPKTLGMRENRVVLRRSTDGGHVWTNSRLIPKPIQAPLEIPTGMLALEDGTNIMSCATWKDWNGGCPHGHRVLMAKSKDRGGTWGDAITIFHDPEGRTGFWEGRIISVGAERMLATCWAHDWISDRDLPNPYALSDDAGETWTSPSSSPVNGQTGWPLWLGNDTLLFVYNHRRDPVGVRGQLARIRDGQWIPLFDECIWSPADRRADSISKGDYAVTRFQFGAPSAIGLAENTVLAPYWCVRNGRAGIQYTKLSLRGPSNCQ